MSPRRPALCRLLSLGSALLLGWALLAPALASAADAPTSPPAHARNLHLLDQEDLRDDEDAPRLRDEGTSAAPLLPGVLLGTVTSLGMGLGFVALGSNSLSDAVFLFVMGANVGFPLGVWMGGALAGGEGWFGATMAGAAPAVLFGVLAAATGKNAFEALFALSTIFVTPVATLVAYSLTDEYELKQRSAARVQVRPLLSASSEHALVGLQGRF